LPVPAMFVNDTKYRVYYKRENMLVFVFPPV